MMACMRVVSLVTHCTLFPESLTRKLYRKKIPEMTCNVTHVTRKIIIGNTGNTSDEASSGVKR